MSTIEEIRRLIPQCDLQPSEDTNDHILNMLDELAAHIQRIETRIRAIELAQKDSDAL